MLELKFLWHFPKVALGYKNMIEIEKSPVASFRTLPREWSHILCILVLFPYIKKPVTHISGLVGDRKLQNPSFYRESQHFYCKFSFCVPATYQFCVNLVESSAKWAKSPIKRQKDRLFWTQRVSQRCSKWKFTIEMLGFLTKWGVLQLPITYHSRDMSNGLFYIGKKYENA